MESIFFQIPSLCGQVLSAFPRNCLRSKLFYLQLEGVLLQCFQQPLEEEVIVDWGYPCANTTQRSPGVSQLCGDTLWGDQKCLHCSQHWTIHLRPKRAHALLAAAVDSVETVGSVAQANLLVGWNAYSWNVVSIKEVKSRASMQITTDVAHTCGPMLRPTIITCIFKIIDEIHLAVSYDNDVYM